MPWRYPQDRLKTAQRFCFLPQVPLDVQAQQKVHRDELRALPWNQKDDILGPLFEDNHPVLTDGTFSSFLSAFNKRCNYSTDQKCDPYIIKSSRKLMRQLIPEPLSTVDWTKELYDDWKVQFPLKKQKRLDKAVGRLEHFRQEEFAAKDVFEKVELLMKAHDPGWAGRIVNASTDLHNAISGPLIAVCLKRLVQSASSNADTGPKVSVRFAYGDTPQSFVGDLEGDGPFIEADFSANDKLQVSDVNVLQYDWAVRLGMPSWLARCILKSQFYTVQSRRFGVKARLKFQLPSGSTSTTFRNCIWNGSIFAAWCYRFGVRSNCVILGDDMLARMSNGLIPRRARRDYEHIAKMACMKAKVFVREHLVDCEFLSRRFVPTVNGHLMIPKLGKALGRFNGRANNSYVDDNSYMAGKSLSYAYEFRHHKPSMEAFMRRFLACNVSIHKLDMRLLSYSVREMISVLGDRSSLLRFMGACVTISDDEMSQYVHYQYGVFCSEYMRDLEHLLFGTEDLPIAFAAAYLQRDVW